MKEGVRKRLREIAEEHQRGANGGHRADHTARVVRDACKLAVGYPQADLTVLETAAWLHDIGHGRKRHKGVSHAVASAEMTAKLLPEMGYTPAMVAIICQAIVDHRYSSGRVPESLEGKLLQDADRLDALGAIGIARAFADSTERYLYDMDDPLAEHRPLDDHRYTLDHFFTKLLTLTETMHTPEARALAAQRVEYMRSFLREFADEIALPTS